MHKRASVTGRLQDKLPKARRSEVKASAPFPCHSFIPDYLLRVLDQEDTLHTISTTAAMPSITSQQQSNSLHFEFPCFCCSLSQTSCCLN